METLSGNSLCTPEQLEAFLIGFSQASPRFQLVEVGAGKEAVDAKIKGQPGSNLYTPQNEQQMFVPPEYLHAFTRFPQTLRIFIAGMSV